MRKSFLEWLKDAHKIEKLDDAKPENLAKYHSEYADYVGKWLEENANADKEELQKAIKDQEESTKKALSDITKALVEIGEQAKLNKQKPGSKNEFLTDEELANKAKAAVKGDDTYIPSFKVDFLHRAEANKATTTTASVANNARALDLPDIGQLATRRNALYEALPKTTVPANANGTIRYIDWDQATINRAAATMAEEGAFPESTAAWETYTNSLKKIGDSMPWTDEFEYDDQFLVNEMFQFIRTNVDLIKGNQIINGDGLGNNLSGMITIVPTYTPAASGITDASVYDLFIKLREEIETGARSKYLTDFAVMNIVDINKYKLKKDANNNYVMPPFVDANGQRIDGVTVIEDNAVVANTMFIGDRQFARIYEQPGLGIETGYINTDFTEGRKRLRLYNRLLFLIRQADRTGFLQVTDIDAALTTLAS